MENVAWARYGNYAYHGLPACGRELDGGAGIWRILWLQRQPARQCQSGRTRSDRVWRSARNTAEWPVAERSLHARSERDDRRPVPSWKLQWNEPPYPWHHHLYPLEMIQNDGELPHRACN